MTRRYDEAIRHVQKTIELDPNFGPGYVFLAYAERSGWLLELKIDPSWHKLRDDSRFEALQRKIQHPAPPSPN
jgi:hypothetical protein